jgi:hypothetical protein
MILRLTCTTIAVFSILATSSAQAASPAPRPPLDLGQTSFLDGEAGPGGLVEVIGNGYVASQFTDVSGGRVAGTTRQSIGTVIFHIAYVSNLPLAGGVLGAEALIPFSALHLDVPDMPKATEGCAMAADQRGPPPFRSLMTAADTVSVTIENRESIVIRVRQASCRRAHHPPTSRVARRPRPRSSWGSTGCTGGFGTVRPRMPRRRSIASASSCLSTRASAVIVGNFPSITMHTRRRCRASR